MSAEGENNMNEPLLSRSDDRNEARGPSLLPDLSEDESLMLSVGKTDVLFHRASWMSTGTWVALLMFVYTFAPQESIESLEGAERDAAALACFILGATLTLVVLIPLFFNTSDRSTTGILYAAIHVQVVSMITNAILAWFPNPVMVDPHTHARVFLVRWCEWVPLAGLMTFFAEGIDIPRDNQRGLRTRILSSLSQTLSCFCGMIFPFCRHPFAWGTAMVVSTSTYLIVFPRIVSKYKALLAVPARTSLLESERYNRVSFAYRLVLTCGIVWTMLVVFFFTNAVLIRVLPEDHRLRHPSLAMILDTTFDVIAKSFYMKLIMDVYLLVFDSEGRAQRQLTELRRLVSILWDSVSDVIVISVRGESKTTTMLSPSYNEMMASDELHESLRNRGSAALVIESIDGVISSSYFVDSSRLQYGRAETLLSKMRDISVDSLLVTGAFALALSAWEAASPSVHTHKLKRSGEEEIHCEIKISHNEEHSLIAIVRDATERYRRHEAERKAHSETIARQRDAQAINRFTRHEVKNGLLAGIELCHGIKNQLLALGNGAKQSDTAVFRADSSENFRDPTTSGRLKEDLLHDLDSQLHETLEIVLAEAMARDVVHEVYIPRLERCDITELFTTEGTRTGSSNHPLELIPKEIPNLRLDRSLIRYIHRNAVSNACKYGKHGGEVKTVVMYDADSHRLTVHVVNEPGVGHEEILELGDDAPEAVFMQGKRLHSHLLGSDKHVSSGDGAWIMQKCAKILKGHCSIEFKKDETVFAFECPAKAIAEQDALAARNFALPPGTIAVAIDDSKIQRKLMDRILGHLGVVEEDRIIIGKDPRELDDFKKSFPEMVAKQEDKKFLVIVDENLDFRESDADYVAISGSMIMSDILEQLSPGQEGRVLVLVRSANDSAKDLQRYAKRTHGFFPKAPMQRDSILELMAPIWFGRFGCDSEPVETCG